MLIKKIRKKVIIWCIFTLPLFLILWRFTKKPAKMHGSDK